MLKPISKIALILIFTFISGLVMTDCILPEIQSEERAEIEIEEEREIEFIEQIENVLVSKTITDEGGKKISINQYQPELSVQKVLSISKITENQKFSIFNGVLYQKLPKYILYSSLKIFS